MRRAITCLLACFSLLTGRADDNARQLLDINGYVRMDYQYFSTDGKTNDAASGFRGKYFLLRVDGNICENLDYSWRQRLNKSSLDAGFWEATDWVYVNYHPGRWSFQAGKEIVQIGSYEYDRNPADVYGPSVFWNGMPCFQIGASVGFNVSKNDNLTFQVIQSPFHYSGNRNMFGYNLIWVAKHGIFQPRWALNLFEYQKNKYISYISLGSRFDVGRLALEFDLMNRAAAHQTFIGRDASVMANLIFTPSRRVTVFGKVTYDVNKSHNGADCVVMPGTEMTMAGAGVEYYPLLKARHALRLHLNCFYAWGKNGNIADDFQDKTLLIDCGVSYKIDIFKLNRK